MRPCTAGSGETSNIKIAANNDDRPRPGPVGEVKRSGEREVVTDKRREWHAQDKSQVQQDIQCEYDQGSLQTTNRNAAPARLDLPTEVTCGVPTVIRKHDRCDDDSKCGDAW